MRKRLLTLLTFLPFAAGAQTIANFETPVLPKADTFYLNYGQKNMDRGFNSGLAHFPFYTDSFGTSAYWASGFSYSNVSDSVSGGPGNQFAARSGGGVNGSSQYAVAHFNSGYGDSLKINLTGKAVGKGAQGFYVTNSSYAYYSMKFGDGFARKFGDTTGTHSGLPKGGYPDFFRFVVRGYQGSILQTDTVQYYLADYRFADSSQDYIIKDWRWVSLLKLGMADSFKITLESSDTAAFGGPVEYLNNPAYFCIDDFITNESLGVHNAGSFVAKVYPNPVQHTLHIEFAPGSDVQVMTLFDMSDRMILTKPASGNAGIIDMSAFPAGNYYLQLSNNAGQTASQRILRQ